MRDVNARDRRVLARNAEGRARPVRAADALERQGDPFAHDPAVRPEHLFPRRAVRVQTTRMHGRPRREEPDGRRTSLKQTERRDGNEAPRLHGTTRIGSDAVTPLIDTSSVVLPGALARTRHRCGTPSLRTTALVEPTVHFNALTPASR